MTGAATRGSTPARPVEIELKYRPASRAAGERYLSAVAVAGLVPASRTRTIHVEDRYVDSADGALARAGFAARMRITAGSTIVSLKSTAHRATGAGPYRREELEGPADLDSAPRDWPASDARSLVLELCGDAPLVELVTIRQQRRKRDLRDRGTTLEVSLDDVEVLADGEVLDRFLELEVELAGGDESRLASVGRVLDADPELDASPGSKLEAALAAVQARPRARAVAPPDLPVEPPDVGPADAPDLLAEPPDVVPADAPDLLAGADSAEAAPARSPGVLASDPIAEAGRKVLRFHFARMLAREAGTRDGRDPEDLHAMRVATRRMRAAWRVFGDGFRPGRTKRHRAYLREIAGRLGAVRDLDVLIAGAEAWQADLPRSDRAGLKPLLAAWRGYRDDAREQLVRDLDSDDYAAFVESFRVFVQTEGAGAVATDASTPHRVRDTAGSRAWAAYERVRAYEPVLRWADVETLHELRIAAKWLRYTLEFVRETLGPDAALLVPRIVVLQDHLGELNDAVVAGSMARTFLVEHADLSPASAAVIGQYLNSREREIVRLRRTVGVPWRGLAGLTFRRRLGRALAGL